MQLPLSLVAALILASPSDVRGFVAPSVGRTAFVSMPSSVVAVSVERILRPSSSSSFPPLKMSAAEAEQFDVGTFVDIEQIRRDADAIFSVIDKDGSGDISLEELSSHLSQSGYDDSVVSKIFRKMDKNRDGGVSREEFQEGMIQFTPLRSAPGLGYYNSRFVKEIHADADSLFRSVDSDADGAISAAELKEYLSMTSSYSDKAIDNIFGMLDVDGDGEISKDEVRDAFVKYSALRQAIGEGPNYK